jgi:membrane protein implicated in regulation of membrane protease activity
VIVGVLLLLGIVPALLVGLYDRMDPTLLGFPFFYWFQFLLIPVTSVLTYTVYRMLRQPVDRPGQHRGDRP